MSALNGDCDNLIEETRNLADSVGSRIGRILTREAAELESASTLFRRTTDPSARLTILEKLRDLHGHLNSLRYSPFLDDSQRVARATLAAKVWRLYLNQRQYISTRLT